jgi:hypothetical protein
MEVEMTLPVDGGEEKGGEEVNEKEEFEKMRKILSWKYYLR